MDCGSEGAVLRCVRWLVLLMAALCLAPVPAQADDRPVLRVGTEGTYPPFSFHDQATNALTGYDVDVMKAVAEKAQWRIEFVETTFDAIFAALDSRRIDVIANQVTVNPEREHKYALSVPYTYSRGAIVVKSGRTDISSLADLEGKTTAQSITTNYAKLAREAGAKIQGVEGFAQAAALLTQGRVDAVINDNIAVLDYLNTTGSDAIEIAGFAGTEQNLQSLAFRRADADLRRQADAALKELAADGTLAKISQRYFKADVSRADGGDVDLSGGDRGSSTTDRLRDAAGPMFKGLLVATIPITILSFAIGLVIAVAAALARVSGIRVLDYLARAYISLIRGTPLLLQLFIVFYGLPEIGVTLGSWPSAVIALSINVGAYAAEIVRSAILAVPRGQFEAASSIGMTYRQSLRRIILPQAARTAVPPLSNTLISLLKDTSLLSVVLVTELTREAQYAASASGDYLALYAFAGLYYWVVCTVASFGQSRLEARMNRSIAA